MLRDVAVLIVGAGPAGLAAAWRLRAAGTSTLLVDAGGSVASRSRQEPTQQVQGVGGAGLYSDGKFSFFPASTGLWSLAHEPAFQRAWSALSALLRTVALEVPPLPETRWQKVHAIGWSEKSYPSYYVSLADRVALIDRMVGENATLLHTRVHRIERANDGALHVTMQTPDGTQVVRAGEVLLACGRFLPWSVAAALQSLEVPTVFRRIELGVRLETAHTHPLFQSLRGVDPKWIHSSEHGESWRTFCLCRQGETVATQFDGFQSYSGRADGPPTSRSNVGLLVRWSAPHEEATAALSFLQNRSTPGNVLLDELFSEGVQRLEPMLGPAAEPMLRALQSFAERFPLHEHGAVRVFGPCLEGLGLYPDTTHSLEVRPNVWIAGDGTGRFRGLVAALASGLYVAERVLESNR